MPACQHPTLEEKNQEYVIKISIYNLQGTWPQIVYTKAHIKLQIYFVKSPTTVLFGTGHNNM